MGIRRIGSGVFVLLLSVFSGCSSDSEPAAVKIPATADIIAPVPANNGVLAFSSVTTAGVTVAWSAATDDTTPQSDLTYKVYYSTVQADVASTASIAEAALTGIPAEAEATSIEITGLLPNTAYYMNVIVSDAAGNAAAYTASSSTTLEPVDTGPATVGGSGTLTASNVATSSLTLSWAAATDAVTNQADLTYQVYLSYTATGVVDTLENINNALNNTGDILAVGSNTAGATSLDVTGLASATTYYFNVVVTNAGNYQAAYTQLTQATVGYMYLYLSPTTTGSIPGSGTARQNVDAFCSGVPAGCSTFHAVINTIESPAPSGSDTIENMRVNLHIPPTYVVRTSNIGTGYQVASNWNNLLANGPCNTTAEPASTCAATGESASTLAIALGQSRAWSGSGLAGAASGSVCKYTGNAWGSSSSGILGNTMHLDSQTASSWLNDGFGYTTSCDYSYPLLCVCW